MKPSELKKDSRADIRINSEMKKELKKRGLSVQKLFDKALNREIKIRTK